MSDIPRGGLVMYFGKLPGLAIKRLTVYYKLKDTDQIEMSLHLCGI